VNLPKSYTEGARKLFERALHDRRKLHYVSKIEEAEALQSQVENGEAFFIFRLSQAEYARCPASTLSQMFKIAPAILIDKLPGSKLTPISRQSFEDVGSLDDVRQAVGKSFLFSMN
jgi:hypothetical protein